MDSDEYCSSDGYSDDDQFAYEEEDDTLMFGSEAASDDAGADMAFDADAEVQPVLRKAQYAVFTEEQLRERQKEALGQVTSVLSISEGEAQRVLRLYKWDVSRVQEEWFTDEAAVRGNLGIQEAQPEASTSDQITCGICFESFCRSEMCSASCAHFFCKDCWTGYVTEAIASGPSCLSLRCPDPGCKAAVPRRIVLEVANPAGAERYEQYALRSYVEDNRKLSWCPAPGCEHAVECLVDLGREPMDVACKCGSSFCFQCHQEAHRPVDCETVAKWIRKNSAESENLNWILANTKPCPKCKRPIEKNQGCMHMTCSQCRFEFCWLCQGSWQEHGERTGGLYACNRYETAKKRGEYDEEAQKREHAKQALERYMHYYQRWAENDKSRVAAIDKMKLTAESKLERLSNITATPTSQLKFVIDAWTQFDTGAQPVVRNEGCTIEAVQLLISESKVNLNKVVECRRILKWTYAFGYYNFGEQSEGKAGPEALKQQQEFFEFNQGQAEMYLERLHGVAEQELDAWLDEQEKGVGNTAERAADWGRFRERMIGLTDVTHSHFTKLVQELEKGLEAMLSVYTDAKDAPPPAPQPEPAPEPAPSASRPAKAAPKSRQPCLVKRTRAAQRGAGASGGEVPAADLLEMDSETEVAAGFWQCRSCTFANPDLATDACEICEAPRVRSSG